MHAPPDRWLRAGVCLAAAVLFAPLLIALATGRVFVGMDLAWFHIPVRYLYSQALANGDSILWTPALFRGFYLHGEGQLGAMHPMHLLLYWWLPLSVALGVELVAIYAFSFAGMRLYLRIAGLGRPAASLGGLLFAFSGFNVLHLIHLNHMAVAAHIPWILASTECLLADDSRRRHANAFAGMAALVGSAILLGSPQFVVMALLLGAGYAIVRGAVRRTWLRLPLLAAAVAAGFAIGGAQLLPTLDFFGHSNRSASVPGFAMTFSLHPMNLLQLWSPYVFARRVYAEPSEFMVHEFSIYNGAVCTVALFWLALRRSEPTRRWVVWFGLALCGIATLLALGRFGGAYPYLLNIPLIDRFRAPARFIVLVHVGLALLAAVALDEFARAPSRPVIPWRRLWPLALPVFVSASTALIALRVFAEPHVSTEDAATVPRLACGLALIASGAALFAAAARRQRLALAMLPVFAAADLGLWGFRYVWHSPPIGLLELAKTADVPPRASPGAVLNSPRIAASNLALLQGYWLTFGYVGMVTPRVLWDVEQIRRLSGADWSQSNGVWHRTVDRMPHARLVDDVRTSDNVAHDLRAIDMSRTALVDRPVPAFSRSAGTARVSTHRPGFIVVEVHSGAPALLVLTETYDDSWKASDGERELQTARAYGDYLSAVVPSGARSVTFTFEPAAVRYGVMLSLAGLMITFAAALALRRQPAR